MSGGEPRLGGRQAVEDVGDPLPGPPLRLSTCDYHHGERDHDDVAHHDHHEVAWSTSRRSSGQSTLCRAAGSDDAGGEGCEQNDPPPRHQR